MANRLQTKVELLRDWLLDPLALLFLFSLALGLAVACNSFRWWLASGLWVLAFLTASAPAIVNPLLGTLEDRFADSGGCPDASFIVLLGGGIASSAKRSDDYGAMSAATLSRTSAAHDLLQRYPKVRIIVSGGGPGSVTEASMMKSFLIQSGVPSSRIIAEDASANTRENANRVARVLEQVAYAGPVMLVTSALHMPRAAADFEAQQIEVCAVPAGRLQIREVPAWALMPQTSALRKFDMWLHEIVALTIYRFR